MTNRQKLIKKMIVIFLIIQPILDLSFFYSDTVMNLFHISPSTVIRMIMIGVMFLMVFFNKKRSKYDLILYIYSILLIVYFIIHHFNSLNFDYNITGTFNYSFSTEILYFIRMLMPMLFAYVVLNSNINKNDIKKVVSIVVFEYSFVIILSSIFKFGISSYGGGKLVHSIIDIFRYKDILVSEFACQGLFQGANRLGVLLSALFPLTSYFYFYEKSNKKILLLFLQIIALIIIGTKVASYTWLIVGVLIIILYILFSILKSKIKFNLKKFILYIVILLFGGFVLLHSPVVVSTEFENEYNETLNEEKIFLSYVHDMEAVGGLNGMQNIMDKYYKNIWVQDIYLFELYNYKLDPTFWIKYLLNPISIRKDGRNTQEAIINRVIEMNDNALDIYFGVGYSRFRSSKIYLEKDFIMHISSLGIFGVILLLSPYIITLLVAGIIILLKIKKQFRFELLVYCCSLCIFVFVSMICGHVVDEMITYIFMGLLMGKILEQVLYPKKSLSKEMVNEKISLIIPAYNVEEYLEECFESVLRQNVKDLEVIVINDASSDRTREICKKYESEHGFIFIDRKKNKGQAINRNEGIKKATGKYIAFLDSDDVLYDDNLSILYNAIKNEKADIAMSKLNSFNSKGEFGYYSSKYMDDYKVGDIYENKNLINCISCCSKIYETSFIKNIKFLEGTYHEDNSFSLVSYFKAKKIVVVPKYLYYRRVRDGENKSIMQSLNYNKYLDLIKNFDEVLKNVKYSKKNNFLYRYMCRSLSNYIVKNIPYDKRNSSFNDATQFISKLNDRYLIIYLKFYYNLVKHPYELYKKIKK